MEMSKYIQFEKCRVGVVFVVNEIACTLSKERLRYFENQTWIFQPTEYSLGFWRFRPKPNGKIDELYMSGQAPPLPPSRARL